jgi:hypothetical protein
MQVRTAITVVVLGVALSLLVAATAPRIAHTASAPPAIATVLAQAEHPETGDAPHPSGVTETEYGTAATACEVPTGSPAIASGDMGAAVGPGCTGTQSASDSGQASQPQPAPVGQ